MTAPADPAQPGHPEWTWRHNGYIAESKATTDRALAEAAVAAILARDPAANVTLVERWVTDWAEEPAGRPPAPDAALCPRCGADCCRDEADVGVGTIYGPWGCPCGWSENERFDITAGPKIEGSHRVDQWGGLTPAAISEEGDGNG